MDNIANYLEGQRIYLDQKLSEEIGLPYKNLKESIVLPVRYIIEKRPLNSGHWDAVHESLLEAGRGHELYLVGDQFGWWEISEVIIKETWKLITGPYWVSDRGRVKKLNGEKTRTLKQTEHSNGYLKVWIGKKYCYVHRLVAAAFISNPLDKPEVHHMDSDKKNNDVTNLSWVTHRENHIHRCTNNPSQWSRYPGVYKDNGKWVARITVEGKTKHLLSSTNEQECARAYMDAVRELQS